MRAGRWAVAILVLAFVGTAVQRRARAAPDVVVTIKPVHALVAGVMAGVGTPYLLLRGGGSPHSYAMRPSDARALQSAEVVVWVGESLESFFVRPLAALPGEALVVELMEAPGVSLLSARSGGMWETHDQHEGHDAHGKAHDDDHDKDGDKAQDGDRGDAHAHDGVDGHIWLSPGNARAIVDAVARSLSEVDPANAVRYSQNAAAMTARLDTMAAEIDAMLAPVRGHPYVVFHDAYHYFEDSFAILAIGSITISPDRPPGARRLHEIRSRIETLAAVCVFAEPQFQPDLIDTLVQGTGARTGTLDPLGADIEAGPDAYFTLMRRLATALRDCLAPS